MLKNSTLFIFVTTVALIGTFIRFPVQSQAQSRFDTCTLKLFDSSLRNSGSRMITLTNLENLPDGVQKVTIPDLSVAGINFAKRINAYSFRCQSNNGRLQSNAYLTLEAFCEDVSMRGQCYAHTATSIVVGSSGKKNQSGYSFTKASFSVPDKNLYSSFYAIIIPR
jgi:hypothetical protein